MKDAQPAAIHLKDYKAPDFSITRTRLEFELFETYADVRATLTIQRQTLDKEAALVLDGQELELLFVSVDDAEIQATNYQLTDDTLAISDVPDRFELVCVTRIKPQENTSLEGLYKSHKMFCTQCEAEGFRKITYYLDRPDVLSEFTTRITADKSKYPVLLSNGNKIAEGNSEEGRHWVEWQDPFKKPSYLFALVAGDLVSLDDTFTTMSGREISLRIFVEEKDHNKCDHAMVSLKKAMTWDEQVYGREYDLDIFMIVAVDDFNMGAMENKGLNIFNSSCVLASKETTTDDSFQSIEAIVAHEYFHNWSGNRVTCRDWFQLSLKEGFTVFRDSEFSSDMGSRTVKRVEDVNMLRTHQFAEDAGPMAHPVQPASFIEISNFYTLTVYEKGAEVVRMIHSLLGGEVFRKGSDLYFERHDGAAVTIDDFVRAMADASGRDFSQFMNWYRQAGTPRVSVSASYREKENEFELTVKQSCPATPESNVKKPFHMPMALALVGEQGPIELQLKGQLGKGNNECVLELTENEQTYIFSGVKERPVPSLFRNFSAPVKINYNYSLEDLQRIIAKDTDGFCRWDASQQMAVKSIFSVMDALGNEPSPTVNSQLLDAQGDILQQAIDTIDGKDTQDLQMLAYTMALPSEEYLSEIQSSIDVEKTHHARIRVKRKLAIQFYDRYLAIYERLACDEIFSTDAQSIARRSLKNTALSYLVASGKADAVELCNRQLQNATNMTDELAALTNIVHSSSKSAELIKSDCLQSFYNKWQHETLVLNRWFALQATNPNPGTLEQIQALMGHAAFDINNPNKLRALVGGFSNRNPSCFHDRSGSGYTFLSDRIIELNQKNPQIAARLLTPLTRWKKYDEQRQENMKKALGRIQAVPALSKDVYEVVSKSL